MMRRVPVRWRLTFWSAGLLAVVLLIFSVALYAGLRWRLHGAFDGQLSTQAEIVLATVQTTGETPVLVPPSSSQQEGEYFIRLLDTGGQVVTATDGEYGNIPLDPLVVASALDGYTSYGSASVDDDETIRVVTVPVRQGEDGAIVGVLQVGLDRDDIDDALVQLLGALAVATPIMLLIASLGGYILAGRALAPVARITGLANRITGEDLRARLHLDLPDDELGRLSRTFDAMLSRIEDTFERQRRFTGDAAHELRTPLSLMRGEVELALARPRSDDEYRDALLGLGRDLEQMTGLVGSLLTLARGDADHLVLDRTTFDLADLVEVVLEQYAAAARSAGVALVNESEPSSIIADQDQVVQVLVNLIDNALAHTPGGGRIVVGCHAGPRNVRLWIADTGEGIPFEHQARVFDRFYRVDSGRSRVRGGAGLGLAICRAIADAHGGTITLTSAPGKGSRIELSLPADPVGRRDRASARLRPEDHGHLDRPGPLDRDDPGA